jgi:FAD/FMN-containing dehydrogenase
MAQYSSGKVYTNFIGQEPEERVTDAYNSLTYARLQQLKRHYDPENLFRMNINVKPA